MKDKIIKNIPNALTVSRIITSVIAAGAFITGNISLSIGLYTYGAVSDFFDGFLARKLDAFSDVGRKLDALADKLYAGSLLIPSICLGNLLMIIPLILELQISNINLKSQKMGFVPKTQLIGKIKTWALFPTLIIGLLTTVFPIYYPLLLLMLMLTTILQIKSTNTYKEMLDNNILKKKIMELNIQNKVDTEERIENINRNLVNDLEPEKKEILVKEFNNENNEFQNHSKFYKEELRETDSFNKPYSKIRRKQ